MMQPFTALLLALALFSSTSASPIADVAVVKQRRVAGDLGPVVILPSWINPVTGTIWQIGSRQNVQWNSDNVLPEIQADHNASLLLGYVGADNIVYVDLENPLATNIMVGDNEVSIEVPNPETYSPSISASLFVVSLVGPKQFGPIGAFSPTFTITNY